MTNGASQLNDYDTYTPLPGFGSKLAWSVGSFALMLVTAAWAYRCDRKYPAGHSLLKRHYLVFYATFIFALLMFLSFVSRILSNVRIAQQNAYFEGDNEAYSDHSGIRSSM